MLRSPVFSATRPAATIPSDARTTLGEGGGGEPGEVTPLVSSDIENDVHSIEGVSKTFAEVWEPDEVNLGPWDPDDLVPGVGWRADGPGAVVLRDLAGTAATFAAVGDSFVGVIDYIIDTGGGIGGASVEVHLTDRPALAMSWFFSALRSDSGSTTNGIFSTSIMRGVGDWNGNGQIEPETAGTHRAAFILSPTLLAASIDGGAVLSTDVVEPNTVNTLWLNILAEGGGMATFKKIEFFSLADYDAADLPTLSAA